MRILKIPRPFIGYSDDWFKKFIETYNSNYQVDINYLNNLISTIENVNIKLLLYLIYQILLTNELSPLSLNPKPLNGIEFRNPNNNKQLGVYHIHLNDGYVLIWYVSWNEMGIMLNFKYLKHPPSNDNYTKILKEIYKSEYGYNFELGDYFKDLTNILNFNINEILNYYNFVKTFICQ